jgi:hypothetical protein
VSYVVVESPTAAPGSCKKCGGSSKEWFIDMGHSEEFHGAVYYCNECMDDIARACGYLPSQDREAIEAKIENLLAETFDWKTRYEALENSLDSLLRARFLDSLDSDVITVVSSLENSDAGEVVQPETGGSLGEGEGTSPEPGDDEGVDDLHSDVGIHASRAPGFSGG